VNPGVPAEQLSGLLIFDVMIHNFDAQPKNCKITIVKGPSGPVNWFIMSDMGGSFGDSRTKWNLADYQKETTYVKEIKDGFVILDFYDISAREAKVHQRVPLAHAQWFRKQLDKLTDDEIVAAFNAAFATPEMNAAYIAGEAAKIKQLTNPEVSAYAARFRKKIEEFNNKVPAAP
jgi:hypothetical protein